MLTHYEPGRSAMPGPCRRTKLERRTDRAVGPKGVWVRPRGFGYVWWLLKPFPFELSQVLVQNSFWGGGARTRKRGEAGGGRPLSGVWAGKSVKRPLWQPAQPRYADYWAPLAHKRHLLQPAQPQYTNDGASRTRKRHQQEHRPQRPTKRSDPTQHAKGRTGDCPGPIKKQQPDGMSHGGGGGL